MKKEIKNAPLISVLVPMYNTQKTIKRCIKSIIKQTYTNLEIVLLDDVISTGETLEAMKKLISLAEFLLSRQS